MTRSISKNRIIRTIFTQLAPVYDVLEKPLTWQHGAQWRQKAIAAAKLPHPRRVLDACAGTGLLTADLARHYSPRTHIIAIDFCPAMANVARQRLRDQNLLRRVEIKVENVEIMPFPDEFFDVAFMSLGLRFVSDVKVAVRELHRVLKPGGRLVVLELCQPPGKFRRRLVHWARDKFFPKWQQWTRGIPPKLLYPLHDSLIHYPDPAKLSRRFVRIGFDHVAYAYLNGGLATLHHATKFFHHHTHVEPELPLT
ncbi:MAG: class I SAM-dependent methyltransferase [Candidatus Firestonebacteria bacterium]|nr:class I SAM-dependent methyltransferase [Candidatus Firestonebacteria bacterium]